MDNNKIIKRRVDFANWYTSIISVANLIEYGPAKGTMIFKPYSWSIWTNIQDISNSHPKKIDSEIINKQKININKNDKLFKDLKYDLSRINEINRTRVTTESEAKRS